MLAYIDRRRAADPGFSVIDVGGAMGGWSFSRLDALVDANLVRRQAPARARSGCVHAACFEFFLSTVFGSSGKVRVCVTNACRSPVLGAVVT